MTCCVRMEVLTAFHQGQHAASYKDSLAVRLCLMELRVVNEKCIPVTISGGRLTDQKELLEQG